MTVGVEDAETLCPYCWEAITLEVDLSAGSQQYSEDCPVCCQPLLVRLNVGEDGGYAVDVQREND